MSRKPWWDPLQGADVRTLALDNPGAWPAPLRVLLAILVLLGVLVAGRGFYLEGGLAHLGQLRQKEARFKEQVAGKVREGAELEAYQQQLALMQAQLRLWLGQFPSDAEVPGLLEDISRAGLDVGLDFEEIRLQAELPRQHFVQLPIQLTVTGAYHDLATFVSGLAGLTRILTVHDIRIRPVAAGNSMRLRMQLEARTYRYDSQKARS
ncbi:type 4a pilus biogenesis protein PilO [Pseudomonas sp. L5B5]|uniref:type 4a pilus biogenesis protein PilO n=1 Tax=Pseudomonas sp. L5B5 TaxID=2883205 RepID=UPI001CF98E47|nr:type 4a pilus biogenesis protein PilO [Pseudomonas sp. L5B5]UCZ82041.1 type 4a pilus biogenesis protein PilO [Pseudomonas sp. L5B5]